MNQFVARAFAYLLNALHVIFFLAVLIGVFVVSRNYSNVGQIVLITIGAIIGYVVVMGYLTTIIAINENLSAIRDTLESEGRRTPPPMDTPVLMERTPREPFVG